MIIQSRFSEKYLEYLANSTRTSSGTTFPPVKYRFLFIFMQGKNGIPILVDGECSFPNISNSPSVDENWFNMDEFQSNWHILP